MPRTPILVLLTIGAGAISARSAELTDSDLAAGRLPAIGDVVVLSDFTRCEPQSAVDPDGQKGKWWLRGYRTPSGESKMLCVEARDRDEPQACIAPTLRYPLGLEGVYDIWVATYRPVFGGGIDVRLTGDREFATVDPWEEGLRQWPPPSDKVGRLWECFVKTAAVDGQSIEVRQPHGTYQSLWWGLCNAHLAYVRLVRRAPEEVEAERARLGGMERKGVVVDRDGFSHAWNWGTDDLTCILQQVEQFQFGNVEALNWCIGGSTETNFPHPMTDRMVTNDRLGDKRVTRIYQGYMDQGIDILQVLVGRCHELGIKIYASHRANVRYYPSKIWDDHPEWRLDNGMGFDYAVPEARNWYRDMLLYIAEHYDVDGLTIDFSRHRRHFNPGQANQFEHMNAYLTDLRAGLDRIGRGKGKRLVLNASFTCGTWYDDWSPEQQGLDVATWVREGLVDCIMPEGREHMKYIEMCRGRQTKCYPRLTWAMDLDGNALAADLHDPTAEEDKTDRPDEPRLSPLEIASAVLQRYDAGASGVLLFNAPDAWTTLRHLPYPELLRDEIERGEAFGRREGEAVAWE